jgi:subtilisin family serine protease
MRARRGIIAGVGAAVLVSLLAVGASAQSGKQPSPRAAGAKHVAIADPATKAVPGEVLVRFRAGVSSAARNAALGAGNAAFVRDTLVPGLVLARVKPGQGVPGAVQALERRSDVLYAEPNWIYRATATPDDPRFGAGELWGLHNTGQSGGVADADIDAPEAWNTTTGSSSVVVAVVDTGVAYDHPDLAPNIWANPGETPGDSIDNDGNGKVDDHRGWDFIGNDNDPRDLNAHGTHVAGTIGAKGNNTTGVVGVNWNVKLMPVRVLGPQGGTNETVTNGFAYAVQEGAKVVNASLGGGGFSQPMKDVIDAAAATTLFVVAAGNDGTNNESTPQYPCNYTSANLVCVAATTRTDARSDFSNFGATSVDLGAPGSEIVSTWLAYDSRFTDGFETATGWVQGRDAAAPPGTGCASSATANTWARTTVNSVFGSWNAADSPAGNYVNCQNNWFRAPGSYNFAGGVGCNVAYDMRIETELNFDYFVVDASTNGSSWTEVGLWTGSGGSSWFEFAEDLSAFDGQPSVQVRFGLEADEDVTLNGVHVDNVDVRCVSANYTASSYESIQGTSMATPHVAGVAALAWAKNSSVSVATVKSALLNGGDPNAALSSNTVSGRRLNAAGTLALIPASATPELTVLRAGNGGGTITGTGIDCGSDCSESYASGTPVVLTATPLYASTVAWTNCDSPSANMCTMTMNSSKTVTATFSTTPTFADVPTTNPFYHYIEQLFDLGITTGCGTNGGGQPIFCPADFVPRQQMAAFLMRATGETQLNSPTPTFADVPASNPFYGWIERLYEQGVTTGCGTNGTGQLIYCPGDSVPRQQMAAFLIRAFASP